MLIEDDVLELIRVHYDVDATAEDYDLEMLTAALNANAASTDGDVRAWIAANPGEVIALIATWER